MARVPSDKALSFPPCTAYPIAEGIESGERKLHLSETRGSFPPGGFDSASEKSPQEDPIQGKTSELKKQNSLKVSVKFGWGDAAERANPGVPKSSNGFAWSHGFCLWGFRLRPPAKVEAAFIPMFCLPRVITFGFLRNA
jgi:hypothetical protein